MEFTEKDIAQLIKTVEKEFSADLAKAELLAKSEEKAPEAKEKEEKPEHKEEAKPEEKADEKHEEKKENHEAPKADEKHEEKAPEQHEEKPADEKAASHEEKPADEACDYDDEDLEHMHKMYMLMSKAELKAHHDACRKALDGHGMEKCGDLSMAKSETETVIEVKVDEKAVAEAALLKSEVEAEKAKTEALQKNLDAVTEFLTKLVTKTAPQGKAITSLDVITKGEIAPEEKTWTKSEATVILAKKTADPSLTKSDRELINAFYLNGASINSISHLLK